MTAITNPIASLTINGAAQSLSTVEWSMTITHNRSSISVPGQASTATFTLVIQHPATIPVTVTDVIVITAGTSKRFTGKVVSLQLTHDQDATGTPITRISCQCVGNLALLDGMTTGTAGYTEQTFGDRADGILSATGLTYLVNSDATLTLLAETSDTRTVRDVLDTMCETAGATMCDLPDGTILLETYSRRALNYDGTSWQFTTGAWSANGQAWQAARQPWEVPTNAVEWSPTWGKSLDRLINSVTVTYGSADPQATTTSTDAPSIASYGTRSALIETTMRDLADATARASAVITAQSQPRWGMGSARIMLDLLDATNLAKAYALESGDRVIVGAIPNVAPSTFYYGIVEGWQEVITPEGHTLDLYLSDPRYSYAMASWADVSGSLTWAATNAAVTWANTVLASDLI